MCGCSLTVFQCFLRNGRLLLKDIKCATTSKEKCAAYSFTMRWRLCGCFWEYFMFFNERAAAFEKIFNDCFWNLLKEKICGCFLKLCPLKKLFWIWKHILRNPLLLCIFGWITVIKIISKESQLPWKTWITFFV